VTTPPSPIPIAATAIEIWLLAVWLNTQFTSINTRLDNIMTAVTVQQEDLDQLATDLEAVKTNLANEIAALEQSAQPPPAGSLDGVKAALSDLQALQTPPPAPAEPPADSTPPIDAPPVIT
jgi:DNA anti-recombination protein RmuC